MLAHGADGGAEGSGDGEAFGVQRLDQPADRVGDVLVLRPGLAAFHARQVAERDGHVVLRIDVAERDGDEVVARDEAVAEERAGEGEAALAGGQAGDVDLGADVHAHAGRAGAAAGGDGGAPDDHGQVQAAFGQPLREVEGGEGEVAAEQHRLPGREVRQHGVQHRPVAIGGQRQHDGLGAGDGGAGIGGDRDRVAAGQGAGGFQGFARGQRRGAGAGGGPEHGLVALLGEEGGGAEADGAGAEDGDSHGVLSRGLQQGAGAGGGRPRRSGPGRRGRSACWWRRRARAARRCRP